MKKIIAFLVVPLFASSLFAQTVGEKQAGAFKNIYTNNCMMYLYELDNLRAKLKNTPSLPPEQSKIFLGQFVGKAYPIADKSGLFILAIPDDKRLCTVHARRLDTEKAKENFNRAFSKALEPLVSKKIKFKQKNGDTETIGYEWFIEGASSKMIFMLTTTPNPNAAKQALFTASTMTETK